jgi:hypothetical protein
VCDPGKHAWSDHYVCTLCGEIKYSSAPMWVACAKMSSGPRSVWLAIWSCADRDTTSPKPVWPGNALLTERTGGIGERTVQRHIDALIKLGWIARTGETRRSFHLAWVEPFKAHPVKIDTPTKLTTAPTKLTTAPTKLSTETTALTPVPCSYLAADLASDLGWDAHHAEPEPQCGPEPEPQCGPEPEPQCGPEPEPQCGPVVEPQRGPVVEPQRGPVVEPQRGPMVDRARIERAIFSLATEHNVGLGLAPGPTALSPAVERVEAGEATLEDIATICAEYSRRKQAGDSAQGYWRNLFYVASWPRTVLEYLRREPAATSTRHRRARRPASALSGADDYWLAKGREGLTSGPVDPGDAETYAEVDAMIAVLVGGDGAF